MYSVLTWFEAAYFSRSRFSHELLYSAAVLASISGQLG